MDKKLLVLPVLFLALLFGTVAYSADLQKGMDAMEKGDWITARRELMPLAKQGNAKAQYNVGVMCYQEGGAKQDLKKASKWIVLAAEQGYAKAQSHLSAMYVNGKEGVPEDYVLAYMWANIAAKNGNKKGKKIRKMLERALTSAQIKKAKKLSKACKKKNYKGC